MPAAHADTWSARYWSRRYAKGRTSGAGSYGRLATYKADMINGLVRDHGIKDVIEFGVGDGNQAALFDCERFLGVDVVEQVVTNAKSTFADRPGWTFQTVDEFEANPSQADMTVSLDVIYHLVEDEVFENYMQRLIHAASRFVLIYASDHDEHLREKHVRHRAYSDWIAKNVPHLTEVETFEHPFPLTPESDPNESSFAFFRLYKVTP